jgi:uncharacterized protein (DUF608 family)
LKLLSRKKTANMNFELDFLFEEKKNIPTIFSLYLDFVLTSGAFYYASFLQENIDILRTILKNLNETNF